MAQDSCCSGMYGPDGCPMCNPTKYPPLWKLAWEKYCKAKKLKAKKLKARGQLPRRREAILATKEKHSE